VVKIIWSEPAADGVGLVGCADSADGVGDADGARAGCGSHREGERHGPGAGNGDLAVHEAAGSESDSGSAPGYVPYVSAGGRSLRPELRSAPPPGSAARWSSLPEEERESRPVSDEELALLFETRRKLIASRVRRMMRWLPDEEIIEEAVQQAFLEAVKNRPGRPPMPLAWITTVAYRRAINFAYRRARQDPEWPAVPEVPEERLGHGHAPDPGLWLEATELLRALSQLPERQRQVVVLAAAGYTHRETGERVGMTVRGAENAARRARGALREQLAA
jgi:RNA polymerase sigma factor (sigma-70 family)